MNRTNRLQRLINDMNQINPFEQSSPRSPSERLVSRKHSPRLPNESIVILHVLISRFNIERIVGIWFTELENGVRVRLIRKRQTKKFNPMKI